MTSTEIELVQRYPEFMKRINKQIESVRLAALQEAYGHSILSPLWHEYTRKDERKDENVKSLDVDFGIADTITALRNSDTSST